MSLASGLVLTGIGGGMQLAARQLIGYQSAAKDRRKRPVAVEIRVRTDRACKVVAVVRAGVGRARPRTAKRDPDRMFEVMDHAAVSAPDPAFEVWDRAKAGDPDPALEVWDHATAGDLDTAIEIGALKQLWQSDYRSLLSWRQARWQHAEMIPVNGPRKT